MLFKPSKYQQRIFDWISKDSGNAIVQAVAGSGKTTTLVEASKLLPTNKSAIFVAFNKAIQLELRGRLPMNIEVKTLHSVGLNLFFSNTNRRPELDYQKLENEIKAVLQANGYSTTDYAFIERIIFLKKLIPLLKAFNTNYIKYTAIQEIMALKGFEEELTDEYLVLIKTILDNCKKNIEKIDFDDMIWIPIVNEFKSKTYDWVFVDESQDLNRVQFELVKKLCNGNTRIVAVGDKYQSIYAFRGADTDSMDNFKEYFTAKELPLSICYRCPKSHILLAKEFVPQIEAVETAETGIIEEINLDKLIVLSETDDLVLCRTNAPLVKVAFALIRSGKKATIKGRDIGKGLLTLIKKYKVVNLEDLENRINDYKSLQNEKLMLIEMGKLDVRKKNSLMSIVDSCETILVLSEGVSTIEELIKTIEEIFTDKTEGIVCSSVHKAKGLEADRVFIVNYAMMPHPMAKTSEEVVQELNIKYVALTRAKKELYLIDDITR